MTDDTFDVNNTLDTNNTVITARCNICNKCYIGINCLNNGGVMSRVINVRNIPDDVFREFKAECAMNDVDMTTAIIRFMNLYTQRGNWEITKRDTKKKYRNLFIAIEHAAGEDIEFNVQKNATHSR